MGSLVWPDRLRGLATLMMILVHVSGPISEHFPTYDTAWWWSANVWDALSRPCVPLFVMLSGYLLFSKTYKTSEFLTRRFSRVLIPALIWAIFYLIFTHFWDGRPASFGEAARMLFEGPVHFHLWFIYLIVGLYLSYPFLAPWVRQASEGEFWLLFGICFFSVFFYKFLVELLHGPKQGFILDFFSNQLAYFVAGYFFGKKTLGGSAPATEKIRPWRFSKKQLFAFCLLLIFFGTTVTAFGTYFLGHETGVFHPYFYDYLTPNVAASTLGWFLLIRHFCNEKPLSDLEMDFARTSYGIYLSHVFLIYALNYDLIFHSRFHPILDIPLTAFLVAFESFVLIWLVQKLPFVGKWLG